MGVTTLVLDGTRVDGLDGFWDEVTRSLSLAPWGRNLDALEDVLRGGFGTPPGGFVWRWTGAARLQQALGPQETERWLAARRAQGHPSHWAQLDARLVKVRAGQGETLFDELVSLVRGAAGPDAALRRFELVFEG